MLIISEVAPWASGNSPVGADWFEVTNIGAARGRHHRLEDGRQLGVARGGRAAERRHQHRPGRVGDLHRDRRISRRRAAAFSTPGSAASAPAGLQIGSYSGAGVGLSTGGDAVNLFDAVRRAAGAGVIFGASPAGRRSRRSTTPPGSTRRISLLSVAGVNGAFVAARRGRSRLAWHDLPRHHGSDRHLHR